MSEHFDNDEAFTQHDLDVLVIEVEAHLGRIATDDDCILSGDLGPIGEAMVLDERRKTLKWWLSTPFVDEVEEDEED